MSDKTTGELQGVPVGELPVAPDVYDDTLIPVEQQGEARHMTGAQWKAYAVSASSIESATAEVDTAPTEEPSVVVTMGGKAPKRTLHFAFRGIQGAKAAQPDYAENDPAKPSHILNRTHWKEVEPQVRLFEVGETTGSYRQPERIGLEVGQKYETIYNGYIEDAVGVAYAGLNGETGVILVKDDGYNRNQSDTGLRFSCIDFSPEAAEQNGYGATVVPMDGSQITNFVITGDRTTFHKLDRRYLPDDIGGVKTVNGNAPDENGNVEVDVVTDYNDLENKPVSVEMVEVLPETTVEFDPDDATLPDYLGLEVGNQYTVNWNGVAYDCVAVDSPSPELPGAWLGNVGALSGGNSTGEPFIIAAIAKEVVESAGVGVAVVALDGSSSATLSIAGENVKKLDGKYLPGAVPYVEYIGDVILPETDLTLSEADPLVRHITSPVGTVVVGRYYDVTYVYGTERFVGRFLAQEPEAGFAETTYAKLTSKDETFANVMLYFIKPDKASELEGAYISVTGTPSTDEGVTIRLAIGKGCEVHKLDDRCLNGSTVVTIRKGGTGPDEALLNYAITSAFEGKFLLLNFMGDIFPMTAYYADSVSFGGIRYDQYPHYVSFNFNAEGLEVLDEYTNIRATNILFADGETLQQKYDSGELTAG